MKEWVKLSAENADELAVICGESGMICALHCIGGTLSLYNRPTLPLQILLSLHRITTNKRLSKVLSLLLPNFKYSVVKFLNVAKLFFMPCLHCDCGVTEQNGGLWWNWFMTVFAFSRIRWIEFCDYLVTSYFVVVAAAICVDWVS